MVMFQISPYNRRKIVGVNCIVNIARLLHKRFIRQTAAYIRRVRSILAVILDTPSVSLAFTKKPTDLSKLTRHLKETCQLKRK